MMLSLDQTQTELLREILARQLDQLRAGIAHADIRKFRGKLLDREHLVEGLLAKLDTPSIH
jgi:hypothetical protein